MDDFDAGMMFIAVQEPCELDSMTDSMPALAMTYSPWQQWDAVYEADVALCRGTIFPGLDKPFLEGACPCV